MNEILENAVEGQNLNFERLNAMTGHELVNRVAELLQVESVEAVRDEMEAIKVAFYKLHRAEWEAARRTFIDGGGREDDFVAPEDVEELRFKELYEMYRRRRAEWSVEQEKIREANRTAKLQIIDQLKALVESTETRDVTFTEFRTLQERWKEIGAVSQQYVKELWESYNHRVEQFYDYIKVNRELRDLDLKHNLDEKTLLCEQAEELVNEPIVLTAFRKLQELHDRWREVGPVDTEFKEPLWERFKNASTIVNKRHQEHFEGIKDEQKRNLEAKDALCTRAEQLAVGGFGSQKEWDAASEEIIGVQKQWKTIGFSKDNNRIWERFRRASDVFFEQKRKYYDEFKDELDRNLELKRELVAKAESLKDSEQWKKTSDELISLQQRWKEIGAVRRSQSDIVWKQFRAASNYFFERKAAHFASQNTDLATNLEAKLALLAEIEACEPDGKFDTIKAFQTRWSEIGHVPIKQKDELQGRYKAAIDRLFEALRAGEQGRRMNSFRERVNTMKSEGGGRLRSEREKLFNKVKQLESEIATLENNVGFFAHSKGAEKLVADVQLKIEKAKAEKADIIERIKLISED